MAGRQKLIVNQIADDLRYERAWNLWEKKESDEGSVLSLTDASWWLKSSWGEGTGGVQRTGEQIATVHDVACVEGRAADPVSPFTAFGWWFSFQRYSISLSHPSSSSLQPPAR